MTAEASGVGSCAKLSQPLVVKFDDVEFGGDRIESGDELVPSEEVLQNLPRGAVFKLAMLVGVPTLVASTNGVVASLDLPVVHAHNPGSWCEATVEVGQEAVELVE